MRDRLRMKIAKGDRVMRSAERKIIENIILINPLIYGLQDNIEKEQECVIADMTSPADKVIKKLYALDRNKSNFSPNPSSINQYNTLR